MRNVRKRHNSKKSTNNENFAKIFIVQIVISIIIFAVVTINSKFTNRFSVGVNEKIKYYLTESYDFNDAVQTAEENLKKIFRFKQILPVFNPSEGTNESVR